MDFLRKYDMYIKPHQDFSIKTAHGGLVTLSALILIFILFSMELLTFLSPAIISDMRVDTSRKSELPILLDITFPKAPCDALTFSYTDVAGRMQTNLEHSMKKQRLYSDGKPIEEKAEPVIIVQAQANITQSNNKEPECGSCYGAESDITPCCNTCDEVMEAYKIKKWSPPPKNTISQCLSENPKLEDWGAKVKQMIKDKEGCRIHGSITVNRVAGNLYIAPGATSTNKQHGHVVHDYPGLGDTRQIYEFIYGLDHAHKINEFHFGEDKLPNQENPLEGLDTYSKQDLKAIRHTYFLKIVPSTYEYLKIKNSISKTKNVIDAAQYSLTQHTTSVADVGGRLPGIFFDFQISPMLVRYKEQQKSLSHFLTNLVSIIGGIVAVAGLIDTTLYRGLKSWQKKAELGKL